MGSEFRTKATLKRAYCDMCDKSFTRAFSLRKHQIRFHPTSSNVASLVQCLECDKCFTKSSSMARHMRSKHDKTHVYSCVECDGKFSYIRSLKLHYHYVHEVNRGSAPPRIGAGAGQSRKERTVGKAEMMDEENDDCSSDDSAELDDEQWYSTLQLEHRGTASAQHDTESTSTEEKSSRNTTPTPTAARASLFSILEQKFEKDDQGIVCSQPATPPTSSPSPDDDDEHPYIHQSHATPSSTSSGELHHSQRMRAKFVAANSAAATGTSHSAASPSDGAPRAQQAQPDWSQSLPTASSSNTFYQTQAGSGTMEEQCQPVADQEPCQAEGQHGIDECVEITIGDSDEDDDDDDDDDDDYDDDDDCDDVSGDESEAEGSSTTPCDIGEADMDDDQWSSTFQEQVLMEIEEVVEDTVWTAGPSPALALMPEKATASNRENEEEERRAELLSPSRIRFCKLDGTQFQYDSDTAPR